MKNHNKTNLLEVINAVKKLYKTKDTKTACPFCDMYRFREEYNGRTCILCPNAAWEEKDVYSLPCENRVKLYHTLGELVKVETTPSGAIHWPSVRKHYSTKHYVFWSKVYKYISKLPPNYISDPNVYRSIVSYNIKTIANKIFKNIHYENKT